MSTFADAFKNGQLKARDAQNARASIKELVDRLSAEVFKASEERISIKIGKSILQGQVSSWVDVSRANLLDETSLSFGETYLFAVDAQSSGRVSAYRLAQWEQSDEGFPCTVGMGGSKVRRHNIDALESALVDILGSAYAGEVFGRILSK